jgi:rifampicin phosphotransferase
MAALMESLDSPHCTLALAGSKGANLSLLRRAGFPVPDGFVLTTAAYRRFVEATVLGDWLMAKAEAARAEAPGELEASSGAIRKAFATASIPEDVADAVHGAYQDLGRLPVAVRSSATAEDLPDLSFAGQQETFLNVVSERAVLDAVLRCWSSLWTARAIGYRSRHGIGHRDLALAVVIQRMVSSESSGVLFTANPLSGKRTEAIVEATLGLGEALVSGRVEPDRYCILMPSCQISSRTFGSKRFSLRPLASGGTAEMDEAGAKEALNDERVLELARLGARAAELMGGPQDIEFALARGNLWILQSRPITSIYPLPKGVPLEPPQVFFSVGAVQGMLDPFTPLGQDVIRLGLVKAMTRRLGFDLEVNASGPIVVAGDRLFVNATSVVRRDFLRNRIRAGLALVEPGTLSPLERLFRDSRFAPTPSAISRLALLRFARAGTRVLFNAGLNVFRPRARRARILRRADAAVAALEGERDTVRTLAGSLSLLDHALEVVPRVLVPYLASGIVAGIGLLRLLHGLARGVPEAEHLVLEATRGLPHNVTTEMDLALWRVAQDESVQALHDFLVRYGMRGVGEIDIGRPRWREDMSQLRQVMEGYRRLPPDQAPDAVFSRRAASAEAALEQLHEKLRGRSSGWWRAPLARWTGRRMRALAGLREAPKFFIVRMMGVVREALLAVGGPDVFFLRLDELRAVASQECGDFGALIAERRAAYEREKRRRRIPRILLSDGEAFYGDEAKAAEGDECVLVGSGVSPGVVEGVARIVFDPAAAQLSPGEILVCPGTDPAWTPLFLVAGGLVTEVGGLLTHGSIVAREYGIPAVVGVREATTRLVDGHRVRVDGFAGRVTVIS